MYKNKIFLFNISQIIYFQQNMLTFLKDPNTLIYFYLLKNEKWILNKRNLKTDYLYLIDKSLKIISQAKKNMS